MKLRPNQITSLDAAMTLLFYIGRPGRGTSEFILSPQHKAMKTTLKEGLGCVMAITGLLLVVLCNRVVFPRPVLVRIESFIGEYHAQELPYPLPTAPAATVLWIVVTGTGGLVCLWGVWLYLKARRAQHEVRT